MSKDPLFGPGARHPLSDEAVRQRSEWTVAMVNRNRGVEEQVLRILDEVAKMPMVDQALLSSGRMQIRLGFLAANAAIVNLPRVELPWAGIAPTMEERKKAEAAARRAAKKAAKPPA